MKNYTNFTATALMAYIACIQSVWGECKIDPLTDIQIYRDGDIYFLDVSFIPNGEGRNIRIDSVYKKQRENVEKDFEDTVKNNLPSEDCGIDSEFRSSRVDNAGNGTLIGTGTIRVWRWLCIKADVPVFHDWKMSWETKVVFREDDLKIQKTVDSKTRFTGIITDANGNPVDRGEKFRIEGKSWLEGFSDLEKFFQSLLKLSNNVIKFVSFNKISYDDLISIFDPDIPETKEEGGEAPSDLNYHPQFYKIDLVKKTDVNPPQYWVHAYADDIRKCSVAKSIRKKLLAYAISLHKEHIGYREHTVVNGDTLWDISEKEYGAGYYHVMLAKENNINNWNRLANGQVIGLPTLSSVSKKYSHTANKGDTLWGISESNINNPSSNYSKWTKEMRNYNRDPNLIYVGEMFE